MKLSSKKLSIALATSVMCAFTASSASATLYTVDYHDPGVWASYNEDTSTFGLKFQDIDNKDGFWLVVTDGGNPKGDGTSHAILYGDRQNDRITAYTYNGENSSDSFTNGTLLGSYEGVFSSAGASPIEGQGDLTMFTLDVSQINNALGPDFEGVQIGEQAGIWFHQSEGTNFTYADDGSILDYVFDNQMWLDRGNDPSQAFNNLDCSVASQAAAYPQFCSGTALNVASSNPGGGTVGGGGTEGAGGSTGGGGSVPAPGGLALILVGLAGLGRKFRRTNKA